MKLLFEKSKKGISRSILPETNVPDPDPLPDNLKRQDDTGLPELSELEVVRHFTNLSKMNYSVDTHFYPLGSCTMKYNPKILEKTASLSGFTLLHPLSGISENAENIQGSLKVIYKLSGLLCEITGMDEVTTQPLAGAHGELTGIMIIAAYHKHRKNKKKYVIVPDTSHGTNPASAAMAGYDIITVPTDESGVMDFNKYKDSLNDETAAVMLTCPNTLGLFNSKIKEIAEKAHSYDALMYYDGANLNAVMGKVRPGDLGFDVIHINLHKTFGTPHGGGGPGAGPVGVKNFLVPYLPVPRIVEADRQYKLLSESPMSIGQVSPFYGNFSVLVRALSYILLLGKEGLIKVSETAVLNANYIMEKIKKFYDLPFERRCMHEFVISAVKQLENGVRAVDIAKYLIEKGIHPPTIYFPLLVKEAIMIEPTETEDKETLDRFIEVMIEAARLTQDNPDKLHNAPCNMPVGRLDETKAAREARVIYEE